MKYYVIINGVSSETIQGLAIESLPAISKPLQRSKQETIDGRDGDIITKLGYSAYDKTLKIGLWGNYDINEVIKYFDTEGTITFSNEPDMYYNFNILNRIDFINQLEAFRKATITIHCQPFKYKEEETQTLELEEHQAESTSFNLQDTYEAPMKIDLKGNTSQEGTPTPDSPQDIHNVSGNNSIVVCGKNLFDEDNATILDLYVDGGVLKDSSYNKLLYIPCKPNTTYTLQKIASPNTRQLAYTKELPSLNVNAYGVVDISANGTTGTITTGNDAKYLVCRFYQTTQDASTSLDNMKNSIQIEYGSTATTYEAYQSQTYPINLGSIELCKIGTYQDYIYKDSDKWYLHKETGKVVLDGSENWNTASSSDGVRFVCDNYTNAKIPLSLDTIGDLLSNKFIPITANQTSNSHNGIAIAGSGKFVIYYDILKNYNSSQFKTWLSNNNVAPYYALETLTNTEITDTTLISQLNAIKEATSYNGTTNILQTNNDLPFILDIDYFTGTNEITITNNGNTYSKPVLTLVGSGVIGIYLNDSQIFQVSLGTDETIIIDINNMEAYYDATLKNRQVIGDYNNFRLIAGENKIKLTGNWDKLSVNNYSRWI